MEMNDLLAEYAFTEVQIEHVKEDIKNLTYEIKDLQTIREKLIRTLNNTREKLDELRLSVALDITKSARHGTMTSKVKQSNP